MKWRDEPEFPVNVRPIYRPPWWSRVWRSGRLLDRRAWRAVRGVYGVAPVEVVCRRPWSRRDREDARVVAAVLAHQYERLSEDMTRRMLNLLLYGYEAGPRCDFGPGRPAAAPVKFSWQEDLARDLPELGSIYGRGGPGRFGR